MLLTVRVSSYGCTWEVWRALKKLELISAAPRATLTLLSCSPNSPRASITRYTHAKHEPILKLPSNTTTTTTTTTTRTTTTIKTQLPSSYTTSIIVTQILNLPLSSKRTVQSRSWTFTSNVTITLSQHLFTERRPLPACTQNGTPSHPGNTM